MKAMFVAAIGGLLSMMSAAGACHGEGAPGPQPTASHSPSVEGRLSELRQSLKLNDDQVARLREGIAKHRDEMAATAKRMAEARRKLAQATHVGDRAAIQKAAAELGEAIGQRASVVDDIRRENKGVLTPEQVEKLKELRQKSDQKTLKPE